MRKFRHKTPRRVVGLDLAGVEHRPSGFCMLTGRRVQTKVLYEDAEILEEIFDSRPALVAIDLSLIHI